MLLSTISQFVAQVVLIQSPKKRTRWCCGALSAASNCRVAYRVRQCCEITRKNVSRNRKRVAKSCSLLLMNENHEKCSSKWKNCFSFSFVFVLKGTKIHIYRQHNRQTCAPSNLKLVSFAKSACRLRWLHLHQMVP